MRTARVVEKTKRFDLSRTRILVVDDSQDSLDILSQVLLGFGVRNATFCRTVAEAMEKLGESTFDLIVADAEMPEEDALDLTRRLRRLEKNTNFTTPVIVASGYTPREKVAKARDVGANLMILKPVVPGVLLSHIQWLALT